MRMTLSISLGLAALLSAAPAGAQTYRVIVNASNSTTTISKDDLARVYMKKLTTWKGGGETVVVDQGPRSPVRAQFSTQVLGRDVATMKNYWQQSLFAGRGVPPIEQASDAQVLAFVSSNPNAIGYVSETAALPSGVKVLEVTR